MATEIGFAQLYISLPYLSSFGNPKTQGDQEYDSENMLNTYLKLNAKAKKQQLDLEYLRQNLVASSNCCLGRTNFFCALSAYFFSDSCFK